MKAWVIDEPRSAEDRPLELRELPDRSAGAGEVRLRVLACGVCRTDLHVAEGDLPLDRPVVPGHQIVGEVESVGPGVHDHDVGDRVGVTWLAGACGRCELCGGGRENLCAEARFTGWHHDGGYAARAIARADFSIPLPLELSAHDAAPLLCAGVIGYRSLRLAGPRPGERIGLVGFGASAHLTLQVARHLGIEVYVFTRGEEHRRTAREMGAAWAGGLEERTPAECHAQILFAPVGALVPDCLRHLRRGGTLAINAIHASDIPQLPYEKLFGERVIRSVSHLTRRDAVEFLELAADAPIRTAVRVFPFGEANEALLAVKESRLAGQAVLDVAATVGRES